MPKLLNHAAVRRFALDFAKRERSHAFTRVSAAYINELEASMGRQIGRHILQHPSRGKTISPAHTVGLDKDA